VWAAQRRYDLMVVFTFSPLAQLAQQVSWYRAEHPTGRVAVFVPLVVDDDHATAVARGRQYLARYHAVWASAAKAWNTRVSTDFDPAYRAFASMLSMASYDTMNTIGSVFFGCPSYVVDKLEWLREGLNPSHVLFNLDIGAMPFEYSSRTLEALVTNVLPRVASGAKAAV